VSEPAARGGGAAPAIASTPDRVTPDWLTDVLRGAGVLGTARVTAVRAESCGTGQLGECYRLHLAYDRVEDGAPDTLVGKFPSTDPVSRGYAAQVGLYAKEVAFYTDVAPGLAVRTPHAYVAEIAPDGVEFVLLFEDLGPALAVDQLSGCSPDQAVLAVEQAAAMHASSWHDQRLAELPWLQRQPGRWMAIAEVMPQLHDAFVERYRDVLEERYLAVAGRLREGIAGWLQALDEPRCLWHLDYRLDNMLFDAKGGEVPLAVVDWQSVTLGPGVSDVSYFLGAGLLPDDRRRHEEALVRHYHQALCDAGIEGYDVDQCWREYRLHAVQGFFTAVNASVNVKRTPRGDEMFMAMARRHGEQMLDNDTLGLIGA
jgi:aminoglycoside/choline kinase family phosphotransferase